MSRNDFLLAEYKSSWDMIIAIDNRRGTFLSYYALLFGAVASICGSIFARSSGNPSLETEIALFVLLLVTAIVGAGIVWVLNSERKANVRYRKRVNLIREIFLSDAAVEDLAPAAKDSFDKYYSKEKKHTPSGMGETLIGVYAVIGTQTAVALTSAGALYWFKIASTVSGT